MLTAQQLITYALQAVKAPGYTVQAADFLNARLSTLARRFDFDVLKRFVILSVSPGTQAYLLPADYVRGLDCFYYINGLPQSLQQIDFDQYNAINAGSLTQSYPSQWATDPSTTPTTLYLNPMPSMPLALSVRYASQPPDIAGAATSTVVPWFPDSMCLLAMLVADLAQLTDDTRAPQLMATASGMFDAFLKMQGDREGYARTVKLGAGFSGRRRSLGPSKLTGF